MATYDFQDGNGAVLAEMHSNGRGWVANTANVQETAYVAPGAVVFGGAQVQSNAQIYGTARVYGSAVIKGDAQVYGKAQVYGTATVSDYAQVYNNARVYGLTLIYGNAQVYGQANIAGSAAVNNHASISGTAALSDHVVISENAVVTGAATLNNYVKIMGNATVNGESIINAEVAATTPVITSISYQAATQVTTLRISINNPVEIIAGMIVVQGSVIAPVVAVNAADPANIIVSVPRDDINGATITFLAYDVVSVTPGANTGNGTVQGPDVSQANGAAETWTLLALDNTNFTVTGSLSGQTANAVVGIAYDNGIVSFTIQNGTPTPTPFQASDSFVITVSSVGSVDIFYGVTLSHYAIIKGNANVYSNASVVDHAQVYDNADVSGFAVIGGAARVNGAAVVRDSAIIEGAARVIGNATIYENATIIGESLIKDGAKVHGNAIVQGSAVVGGNRDVAGSTIVEGNTELVPAE